MYLRESFFYFLFFWDSTLNFCSHALHQAFVHFISFLNLFNFIVQIARMHSNRLSWRYMIAEGFGKKKKMKLNEQCSGFYHFLSVLFIYLFPLFDKITGSIPCYRYVSWYVVVKPTDTDSLFGQVLASKINICQLLLYYYYYYFFRVIR